MEEIYSRLLEVICKYFVDKRNNSVVGSGMPFFHLLPDFLLLGVMASRYDIKMYFFNCPNCGGSYFFLLTRDGGITEPCNVSTPKQ
jgi:hypothetical protein